jgi:hypothetical protein
MSAAKKIQKWQSKAPLLKALFKLIVSGHLLIKNGHLVTQQYHVPDGFFGIGVTSSNDLIYDDYLISSLKELGVLHVRLDVCAGINVSPQIKLLSRLITEGFRVHLHLLQQLEDAKNSLIDKQIEVDWADFVTGIVTQFGNSVELIEVGATVNRPRWAGYSVASFINSWKIAYRIIKRHGLVIAGPNITDFEPPYTILFLDALKNAHCLPDIYTNNLFAERATEPERYDHKVVGAKFANLLKFNLLKKAQLLKKLANQYAIKEFISPSSFWTLPRIERYTQFSEEKQADYLVRYFVLLAASNTVQKAFWGPLVCHREGLIDEGDFAYPELEKITYYAPLQGKTAEFKKRPSFYAYQAVIKNIAGATYLKSFQQNGVHIFRFLKNQTFIDVAWTINGLATKTIDLYAKEQLDSALIFNRLNQPMNEVPDFIIEQPIFIHWQQSNAPDFPASVQPYCIQVNHVQGEQAYCIEDNDWAAVITARNRQAALKLFAGLHPDLMAVPTQSNLLRKARNAVWTIPHPLDQNLKLVAKKPLTLHFHKKILDRNKPSKARKSWNSSSQLKRRGIGVSSPIAYFEHKHDKAFDQNIYISEAIEHVGSVREMFTRFSGGADDYQGIKKSQALLQLSIFLMKMHGRGVLFRDLSGGNVLIQKSHNEFQFILIDTNRARFSNFSLSLNQRISDLVRICNKLDWKNRIAFMQLYLAGLAKNYNFRLRIPFYLYDLKVDLKRTFGRKGIKKIKNMFWPSK